MQYQVRIKNNQFVLGLWKGTSKEPMTMAAYDIPQIHVKDDFKEMFYDDVVTSVNGNGGSDSDDSYIDMKDEDEKGNWYSKQSQSHNISNESSDVMKKKPQKKTSHQKKTLGQISSFNGKGFPTAIPPRPNKPPGKQGYGMVIQQENIPSSLPNYNRQYQPEYPSPNSLVHSLRDQRTEGRHYEELPDLNGAVRQVKSPPPPPRHIRSPFSPPLSLLSTQPGIPSSPTVDINNTTLTSSLPLQPIQDSGNTRPPSEEFFASSDEMTLGEFVSKHKDDFPVRVRVSRGFYGTSDKWSISEGEYFNIHFVKYTKVVGATDALFGHYTIPLNSSVEFGVFYAPHGNIDAAFTGYEFKTMGDVLKANPVPLAVKATMNWGKDKTGYHSVTNGDVLALRESKGRFKHSLKCIDCFTGKQKSLSYSCAGFFTTCPFELRLYLPEVVQHFSLPQTCAMFINTANNPDLPQNLSTRRVKLTGCSIETSLIATQLDSRISTTTESSPLIEIPIDLDIGVQLVTPKEEEVAQLYEETGHLFSTIDITRLQTIPNIVTMPSDPLAAEALAACHQSRKNIGVEIQQPPRYSVRKSMHPYQANPQYTNQKDKKQSNNKSKRNGSDQFNERILATELDIQRIESSFSQQIEEMKKQISDLTNNQTKLQQLCNDLQTELDHLKERPSQLPPKPQSVSSKKTYAMTADIMSENKATLESLKLGQVIRMLKGLKLQQYQSIFHTKNIDGQKLAKMTREDLRSIGVSIEHQGKLLHVINGTVSPKLLLEVD